MSMGNNLMWRSSCFSIARKISAVCFFVLVLTLPACDGFLDVGVPRTQLVSATAFDNEGTARSALLAIYSEMMSVQQGFASGGSFSMSVLAGLSADELAVRAAQDRVDFQENNLVAANDIVRASVWAPAYKYIYYANAFLEGLSASAKLTPEVKHKFEGEARFLRAFIYFYLTNLFGDIPLILGTDYETNNVAGKASSPEVYRQIIADLDEAQQLLPATFEHDDLYGRTRAGKYAAKALLARVYLYLGDWAKAETLATAVIGAGYYDLVDIDKVFLARNNDEAIWQLMPVYDGLATFEPMVFFGEEAVLTQDLLNQFGLEDPRLYLWILPLDTASIPYKYKSFDPAEAAAEYSMVLRLAEQYLIRAEARAHQGGDLLAMGADDLNAIRGRAGISGVDRNNITQAELLDAIALERRRELFSEWGHRWLDLKRTGRADAVLGNLKGSKWQPTDALYPIPASEIVQNPNLGPQNLGY